jgi:hypothetical protein
LTENDLNRSEGTSLHTMYVDKPLRGHGLMRIALSAQREMPVG